MYRIPNDFDISSAVGQCATQICIGQYDLQFTVGEVHFSVWSTILLRKQGIEVGQWREDSWPNEAFFQVLNVNLARYEVVDERQLVLYFENGMEMVLTDSSDQHESMQIGWYII